MTSLDDTLLTPPAMVMPQGNPEHYREWVYQEFTGQALQHVDSASSWAVRVSQRSLDGTGKNMVLAVEEAIYTTSEGRETHVLGGLWPQQITVPYARSTDVIHDLWNDNPLMALTEREAAMAPCAELGPAIFPRNASAALHDAAPVGSNRAVFIKELRDAGVATSNSNGHGGDVPARPRAMQRSSELVIWGITDANNYDNVVSYHFRDDGRIEARLGATGWNTAIGPPNRIRSGNTPHAHSVLWRIVPEISDPAVNDTVAVIRYEQQLDVDKGVTEDFTRAPLGQEAIEFYDPLEYTRLMISDPKSAVEPAPGAKEEPLSYILTLITDGSPVHRTWAGDDGGERHFDFLIARDHPDEETAQPWPTDDADVVADLDDDESIEGEKVVIYAYSSIAHIPRAEDFIVPPDAPNYKEDAPGNLTRAMWSGVRLMPRNIHARVPFSQPTPGLRRPTPLSPPPLTRACVAQASEPVVEEAGCANGMRQYSVRFAPINQNPFGKVATAIGLSGAGLAGAPVRIATELPYGAALAPAAGAEPILVRPEAGASEVCLDIAMSGADWRCPAETLCVKAAGAACSAN